MPTLARTRVTLAKGTHFTTVGHSASRKTVVDGAVKVQKRLELLPEEALYLIERGSMLCYKSFDDASDSPSVAEPDEVTSGPPGVPMTVQQAYAEMIGFEGLTLERYQVQKYSSRLKRRKV